MTTATQTSTTTSSLSISQRLIAGGLALFIGLVLIGGVGFASDMAIHNGAHDTRHALGFPCH
jgi:cobalt transporter subunit CbtB